MANIIKGKATICVVNYKTLDLTRLCLRSIRKFTRYPYEVLVIDNDSQDDSLRYLKSLSWIRLIERKAQPGESGGGYAHAAALDLGLANCNTEYFVSMHSDVIILKDGWLTDLIANFDDNQKIACVGTGKIELIPQWQIILKNMTDLRTFMRKLRQQPDPLGKFRYYNRTICCIYRTDVLKHEHLAFLMNNNKGLTSGQKLYFEIVDHGYETVELPASMMKKYMVHLAHATQVTNPQEFKLRPRTHRKFKKLADRILSSQIIKDIIADDLLDQ